MSESDTSKWEKAVSALKAAQAGGNPARGRPSEPSPEAVARIVRVAKVRRREWILAIWQSLALKALVLAALGIGIAFLIVWNRADETDSEELEKPSLIIPAPAIDELEFVDGEKGLESP